MSSGKRITATATGTLAPSKTSGTLTSRGRRGVVDANFSEIKLEIPATRNGNSISPVSSGMKQTLLIKNASGASVIGATRTGGGNWTFAKDQNNAFVMNESIRKDLSDPSSQISKNVTGAITTTARNASFVDGSQTFKLANAQVQQSLKGTPSTATAAAATETQNAATPTGTENSDSPESTEESAPAGLTQEQATTINRPPTKLYNGGKPMRYPINSQEGVVSDYIQIQLIEYKKSGLSEEGKLGPARIDERIVSSSDIFATVFLPIQSGIIDNCSVDWGQGGLNPITAKFANAAYGTIAASAGGGMEGLQAFGSQIMDVVKEMKDATPELRQLIVNYFTEQAVNTPGLLSRTLGGAINNNLELLFNGPTLRSFTFSFRLTPRSAEESTVIKEIIRMFKTEMHPALSESELFLLAPNLFKIKYKQNIARTKATEEHPYLNRIKVCALKDFSVNYTPDGSYMTYAEDGSMTSYDLSMTFAEINPIYKQDYEDGEGTFGMGW